MSTFSVEHAVPADVVGACQAADPVTGAEVIAFALQPDDGGEPQTFTLSICGAYALREVIDAALEAPFFWDDDGDEEGDLLDVLSTLEATGERIGIDLPRRPASVRWDEAWTRSHPR